MKPFFQKLVPLPEESIIFLDEEIPHFIVPWHFHPEIEILYVVKSTGTSYIGDSINNFCEGEISIIGENLPHWWKSDPRFLKKTDTLNTKALVIQFRKEIFHSNFINLPEMHQIKGLLERSQRGIQFTGESRRQFGNHIKRIFKLTGLKRITELIILLDKMAVSNHFKYLSSIGYSKIVNTYDFQRFNKIHEYIIRNFQKTISLDAIANQVSMSSTAFCRYFKKRTKKTFFTFLNEFKIGHACKLLSEKRISVSRVCYESGFNNISHFNEQFKRIVGRTPSEYQAEHTEQDMFML
ncbi:MAG: AraC family transcriptional regulator [Bacteroidales bacterium]|nr:AraC family transcriptional regulator [Bacteroidales bacterium]